MVKATNANTLHRRTLESLSFFEFVLSFFYKILINSFHVQLTKIQFLGREASFHKKVLSLRDD